MENNKNLKNFLVISLVIHLALIFIAYKGNLKNKLGEPFTEIDLININITPTDKVTINPISNKNKVETPALEQDLNKADIQFNTSTIENQINTGDSLNSDENLGDKIYSFNINHFIQMIREKIEKMKSYPQIAQQNNWTGEVQLKFLIASTGEVKNIVLLKSSGFNVLDNSAIATVKKAAPFLPFPEDFSNEGIRVSVPIIFNLQ